MYKVFGMGLFCLFIMVNCTKKEDKSLTPKDRLTEYITKSFSVKNISDRAELVKYLTGDAKKRLESWDDTQFKDAFIDKSRTMGKLSIKEIKEIGSAEFAITYEISFRESRNGKETKVTNKKLGSIRLESGEWLISEVQNLKELVEFDGDLTLP